ncbi:MAG: oligosaccharide flippase family protein, partial [Bacteroidetes bacterium]|nr:oligosaccharide flippase family protein [Bacteroidota bacterium]
IMVIIMGQDTAIARFFYRTDDEQERKQIISQALFLELIFAGTVLVVTYFSRHLILERYLTATQYERPILILMATLPFIMIVRFTQNLLKWVFARTQFLFITIGSTVLLLLMTLLYVVKFKMGVEGVFYAQFTAMAVFAVIGLIFCRKYLVIPRGAKYMIPLVAFGWPFMINGSLEAFTPSIDRYFITNYITLEALGIYAVAYRLSFLLKLPVNGFNTAWGPFAFAIYKEKNAAETYNKVFLYYTIVVVMAAFLMILFAEPLTLLFASAKYAGSVYLLVPLVFAVVFESFARITGIGVHLSYKTYFNTFAHILGLVTTIVMVYFLIEPYGLLGVAYSMFAGKVVNTFTKSLFAQILYPIRFNFFIPFAIFVIGFGLSLIYQDITGYQWYYKAAVGMLVVLLSGAMIWRYAMPEEDRQKLKNQIRKIRERKSDSMPDQD